MKPEQLESEDSFIEEFRDSGAPDNALTSRFGFYKASVVDRYIANLQDQVQGTEAVYQDRFEEMRTSLLGMTRERDEKIHQIRDLEQQLAKWSDLEARLGELGRVSLSAQDYEYLQNENRSLSQKVELLMLSINENPDQSIIVEELHQTQAQLGDQIALSEQLQTELSAAQANAAHLSDQLEAARQVAADMTAERNQTIDKFTTQSEQVVQLSQALQIKSKEAAELLIRLEAADLKENSLTEDLRQLRDRLAARTAELDGLETGLRGQRQQQTELALQLETLRMQVTSLTESANQARTSHQLLQVQYDIGQDMVSKLLAEKTALEADLRNQQQRFDLQLEARQARFQSVLNSQSEFLKRLHENFSASVVYMESLTQTGLRGLTEPEIKQP